VPKRRLDAERFDRTLGVPESFIERFEVMDAGVCGGPFEYGLQRRYLSALRAADQRTVRAAIREACG